MSGMNESAHDDVPSSFMRAGSYTVKLIEGHSGIWLFVMKGEQTLFEQPCLKTIEEALEFARSAIVFEEKRLGSSQQGALKFGHR